jgi:hypothetical protein
MRVVLMGVAVLLSSCATVAPDSGALEAAVAATLGAANVSFDHAASDLNNDSRPDAVVLVRGSRWCGSGGCILLIFQGTPTGYSFVSRSTVTSAPIRLLHSSHLGWKDLIVHSNGTGDVLLTFDGTGYPSNPSLEHAPIPEQLHSAQQIIGQAPNNSFKPNPLRSSKTPSGFSGGSA